MTDEKTDHVLVPTSLLDNLQSELKRKDFEILELKDTLEKKDVAFKLITGQQYEELESLKKFLEEIRKIAFAEFYTEWELLRDIKNKFQAR